MINIREKISAIFKKERKDYVAGLDIGSSSIKLVLFMEKEDGLHLVKADTKEIKQSSNEAANAEEAVSALKYLFRDIDVKKSKIIANINCPQTAIKKITTPYMPRQELADGIRLEAKNYFPFDIEESLLDFEILGDITENGVRRYEVLVVACPVKTAQKYHALLGKAGVKPDMFVSSAYALHKLSAHAAIAEGKTRCFLDIGELYTELIILKGRGLMFSRKIPVAGRDFTKAMTGVLVSERGKIQLSWDEAEQIKLKTGIPEGAEAKTIDDKISTTQILALLRQPLEQLTSEIERCFDYYREENGGAKIDAVVLFGGGASLVGLTISLSESLGMEVALGDPLQGLIIEKDAIQQKERISHQLDLAIGAALSARPRAA